MNNRCPRPSGEGLTRRELLSRAGAGFGMVALSGLLSEGVAPTARARSVIWLFMEGGPSAVDLFDPKPELDRRHGQRVSGIDVFFGSPGPLLKSPYSFRRYGDSGAWVCDKYATLARHADDFAFVKSVTAEFNNHAPAMFQMNTGMGRPGFPSVGSWVTYGLGSENRNLPGFVVMGNPIGTKGGPANWSSGFLPGSYQGMPFRSQGQPLLNLERPSGLSAARQREQLDLLRRFNAEHMKARPGEPELHARIASFELAYRMQLEAAAAVDLSGETDETKKLYGVGGEKTNVFGSKLLLARRLVERGVRFVQVYSSDEWDAHYDLAANHADRCAETDLPIAGLLTDLKRRGLLEETLVVWGGEFGRMPVSEGSNGRDHNPHGFLVWMAGGGVRGGSSHGQTDEIGYKAAVDPVSVHDLHATVLHLLGIDHLKLTYRHNGRDFRLTDVSGEVIRGILA